MNPFPVGGLYAVTPESLEGGALVAAVEAVLQGGAAAVQYRDKSNDTERREADARALASLCRRFAVPLIVNDDVALARRVEADGVHVGRDDAALETARSVLGEQAIVGVSCYDEAARARAAQAGGASYVAFGSFFPSTIKPNAVRASLDLVRSVRAEISVPIVAIGGITAERTPALIASGVDAVAVITAVFSDADPRARAHEFAALFNHPK